MKMDHHINLYMGRVSISRFTEFPFKPQKPQLTIGLVTEINSKRPYFRIHVSE